MGVAKAWYAGETGGDDPSPAVMSEETSPREGEEGERGDEEFVLGACIEGLGKGAEEVESEEGQQGEEGEGKGEVVREDGVEEGEGMAAAVTAVNAG